MKQNLLACSFCKAHQHCQWENGNPIKRSSNGSGRRGSFGLSKGKHSLEGKLYIIEASCDNLDQRAGRSAALLRLHRVKA